MRSSIIAPDHDLPRPNYLWPAVAALALAVAFPFYWFHILTTGAGDLMQVFRDNFTRLDSSDLLYLVLGPLEIYVYLSLKRILRDHLNLKSLDFLIILLCCNAALFYIGLFGVEAIVHAMPALSGSFAAEMMLVGSWYASLILSFVYGLLSILVGVVMLSRWEQLPGLLRIFALVLLVCGLLEVTIVFGFLALIFFPLALLILAFYFVRPPTSLELI